MNIFYGCIINQLLPWYPVNKAGTNANKYNIAFRILGSYKSSALKLIMHIRTIENFLLSKCSDIDFKCQQGSWLCAEYFDTDSTIIILLKWEASATDMSFSRITKRRYPMTCCLTKISNLKIYTKKIQLQLGGHNAKREI